MHVFRRHTLDLWKTIFVKRPNESSESNSCSPGILYQFAQIVLLTLTNWLLSKYFHQVENQSRMALYVRREFMISLNFNRFETRAAMKKKSREF